MSKSDSHQFTGTKGQKIEQGMNPENLKRQLVSWAEEVVTRMSDNVSNRKRERFNTACVVFDELTGTLYFGRNGGIDKFGDSIHPTLRAILPKEPLNGLPTPWNCAETDAINQALHNGVDLGHMRIYTISTKPKSMGKAKKSCENCTYAYRGRIKENYTGWIEEAMP